MHSASSNQEQNSENGNSDKHAHGLENANKPYRPAHLGRVLNGQEEECSDANTQEEYAIDQECRPRTVCTQVVAMF